jgi:protein-S-isoprenylcysteine O-methyltransferase Ste14
LRRGAAAAITPPMPELLATWRRHQEPVGRWVGFVVFAVMVGRQFRFWPGFANPGVEHARWLLITLLFVLFWSAYWRRRPALALASRPVEIVLPLVCAGLPLAQYPPAGAIEALLRLFGAGAQRLWQPLLDWPPGVGLTLMALGEAVAVAGMWSLGRSFSIFAEVRELVTSGLYRFVRHPLYLGEMIAVWGYVLAWSAPWSIACALLFTGLQSWRARVEEGRLAAHHPAYAAYREQTGFLLPKLRR